MKRVVALAAAFACMALGRAALAAEPPAPLSAADLKLYSQAFDAADSGDFATAEARLAKVEDASLAGRVSYAKLMHPKHSATFAELAAWMKAYGSEAGAEKIQPLAVRRAPKGAAAPKAPEFVTAMADGAAAPAPPPAKGKAGKKASARTIDRAAQARDAYYSGDVRRAFTLASAAGERWIAGLAAFRLSRPADAFDFFRAVADDSNEDVWLRSAAAFWAARSGIEAGVDDAPAYLQVAAQAPQTFYGMIAERQLALQADSGAAKLRPALSVGTDPIADLLSRASLTAPAEPAAMTEAALPTDARAHRAEALFQLGRKSEALAEAKIGLALAKTDKARDSWQALADAFSPAPAAKPVRFTPPAIPARMMAAMTLSAPPPINLPAPDLAPKGGFTIDKAMVYALVRQESAFNPLAQSAAGAVGLMQLMPDAAARAAGDDKLKTDRSPLFDPAFNLRVGQDYFTWLMERGLAADTRSGYDVLRTVAAYNGGPGVLLKTAAQLGEDCDSLLLIESLPAQETRNYVERVVASYWQYRKMFGGETRTLDALASGQRVADFRLDDGILASSLTYSLAGSVSTN